MAIDDHKARWDAETLAEAKTIESDPSRLDAAKQAAVKLAQDQQDRANGMKKVAGRRNGGRVGRSVKIDRVSNRKFPAGNKFNVFQKV